jgi:DNA primase
MPFAKAFLQEMKHRLTLSEIIGRRVTLQRAGHQFKGCCPFHEEKTPSFMVSDDKQSYHCFGCGAHGDVIDFVMRYDNLGFADAVAQLAAAAGMEMPQQSPQAASQARREQRLYALLEDAAG